MLAARQRDAGFIQRRDADAEPGLYTDLAQGLLDDGARARAHVGCNPTVPFDDDNARLGIFAEDRTEP